MGGRGAGRCGDRLRQGRGGRGTRRHRHSGRRMLRRNADRAAAVGTAGTVRAVAVTAQNRRQQDERSHGECRNTLVPPCSAPPRHIERHTSGVCSQSTWPSTRRCGFADAMCADLPTRRRAAVTFGHRGKVRSKSPHRTTPRRYGMITLPAPSDRGIVRCACSRMSGRLSQLQSFR